MQLKLLFLLGIGSLVVLAAWLVQPTSRVHSNEVPEKYQDVVRKGLDYLAKQQHKDGHWEGDGGKHPTAVTALAGMAFLMDACKSVNGTSRNDGRDKRETLLAQLCIEKAVDWLISKADARQGLIFSGHASEVDQYMYGHGLATQFLAWAFQTGLINTQQRQKLTEILPRAVKYIANAQSGQGGWYRTSKAEGHDFDEILSTTVQVQAILTCFRTAVAVDFELRRDGMQQPILYQLEMMRGYDAGAKMPPVPGRAVDTAAALACYIPAFGSDDTAFKWIEFCQKELPAKQVQFGRDELAHYYFAQAMFYAKEIEDRKRSQEGVEENIWTKYRDPLFEQLRSKQNMDGSWPSTQGILSGPVVATALWCNVLQLDRNSHPICHRLELSK